MKNLNLTLTVFTGLLFLTSCIYESAVPVDKANLELDSKLLSKWQEQKSKDVYTIKKLDGFHYEIDMYSQSSKTTTKMSAYSTFIDGVCFLNLKNMDKEMPAKNFMIVKLEWMDESNFKIYPLTDNIREQFKSSEELKTFIQSNMKDPYFYEEAGIFTKKLHK